MYEKSSCVDFLLNQIKKEAGRQVRIFLLLAFDEFVILFDYIYKYRILQIIIIIFFHFTFSKSVQKCNNMNT